MNRSRVCKNRIGQCGCRERRGRPCWGLGSPAATSTTTTTSAVFGKCIRATTNGQCDGNGSGEQGMTTEDAVESFVEQRYGGRFFVQG
ncbi:hypothetical protein D3C73_1526290 [compost metagenome]